MCSKKDCFALSRRKINEEWVEECSILIDTYEDDEKCPFYKNKDVHNKESLYYRNLAAERGQYPYKPSGRG